MRRTFALAAALLVVPSAALLAPSAAHALTVRPDRPRILFSNGSGPGITPATFKQRCTSDPAYQKRCQGSLGSVDGGYPAINIAAKYVVNGDAEACHDAAKALADPNVSHVYDPPADGDPSCDAHCNISRNFRSMPQLAVVRDWCDAVLDAGEKQTIDDRIALWAAWYQTHYPPGDVFHDDMVNVWTTLALAGLSLKGTSHDQEADAILAKAEAQWKNVILPAHAYVGDWWHEGMTYGVGVLGSMGMFASAWSTATDDDLTAAVKPLFEGYFRYYAYALRPDDNFVYFGDTTSNKQNIQLFHRPVIDLLNYLARSPAGTGLSMYVRDHSMPYYDYSGADGMYIALFYDASLEPKAAPLDAFPRAEWLSRGANDIAVMRSGWGKDDTYVWMSCGDYLGPHQHDEAGAFQIFRKSILTGSDGAYDNFDSDHWANYYSQHSVHANTLAVYAPGEIFPTSKTLQGAPSVNDGGQRTLRRSKEGNAYPSPDVETYKQNKTSGPHYETGDVKVFEAGTCHDYVACDITAAYDGAAVTTNGNPSKVKEVTRQLVFLPPNVVVVFDRVESTDPSFEKRFLLHTPAAPDVNGAHFTVTNGDGELSGQALLPAGAQLRVVSNFEVEGTPHPPNPPDKESGGTRIEIVPGAPAARDYYLTVLQATDAGGAAPPDAELTEDAAGATITLTTGGSKYKLSFAKTGDLAGHLTATLADGTSCDQDLGAMGAGPSGSGGAGGAGGGGNGGAGGTGTDGTTGGGGSGGSGQKGGCGCRTGAGEAPAGVGFGLAVTALAAGLVRRRRRPRS
jgi:MYXO-CTERM domain-containing protein